MCRRLTLSLIVAVLSLGALGASIASAETYTIAGGENSEQNTSEFLKDLEKCNAAASACTIVLGSGNYQPTTTLLITNTTAAITIEGPAGTPTDAHRAGGDRRRLPRRTPVPN